MPDGTQQKEYKGSNGILILTDNGVIIKRGFRGYFATGFLRGDKTIPYSSIIAVQFKKSGLTAGYIQLTLKGGNEPKKGLFEAIRDENSISFHWNNDKFEEAKGLIEERISTDKNTQQNNPLNDLERLAELKDKGIITTEEFEKKKKKILNI